MPSNNINGNNFSCELSKRLKSEFNYLHLLKSTIIFLVIGFVSILLDYCFHGISEESILNKYILITKLNTLNLEPLTKSALEHLAPNSIVYGFFVSFLLCSLHRIIFGDGNKNNFFNIYIILPLIIFVKTLSVATAGIFVGFSIALLIIDPGLAIFTCIATAYPVLYIILTKYIYLNFVLNIGDSENIFRKKFAPQVASRFEGILILILSFVIISIFPTIRSFLNNIKF